LEDGFFEGLNVGLEEGYLEGLNDGLKVGVSEGVKVGLEVGEVFLYAQNLIKPELTSFHFPSTFISA